MSRKSDRGPLPLAAAICQSVGALFMLIFCLRLAGTVGQMSGVFKLLGLGFLVPLVIFGLICAAAAAVFVAVSLWLFLLDERGVGKRLLPASILTQLIVEAVILGLSFLVLLMVQASSEAQRTLIASGYSGSLALATVALLVMAAALIFLHVTALGLTRGRRPGAAAASACFAVGAIHILTALVVLGKLGFEPVLLLLLVGFAAADLLWGRVILTSKR